MSIQELEAKKQSLLKQANELSALKNKRYANMDIASPMCDDEKQLTRQIADLFSQADSIVRQKRAMLQSN